MSKNKTERSLEEKSKKPRYLYHFPLIVGGCIATSMIISAINPDSSAWGIVFVELPYLFIALLLISFIRKAIVPMILSYVIIFAIPVFFVLNYHYVLDIPYSDGTDLDVIKGSAATRKMKCLKFKNKTLFDKLTHPILSKSFCLYRRENIPFGIKNCDEITEFYAGNSFYKKYNKLIYHKIISVYYKTIITNSRTSSLLYINNILYKGEENVVYKIESDDGSVLIDNFNNIYRNQKIRYYLFSFLLSLNSILSIILLAKNNRRYSNV